MIREDTPPFLETYCIMMMFLPRSEIERLLREEAARRGQSLEAYFQGLAEGEAHQPNSTDHPTVETTPADLWVERWRAWAQGHSASAVVADDSRESIYDGRGE
jgi:hypothetical protein